MESKITLDMEIDIDGTKYQSRQKSRPNKSMMRLIGIVTAFGGLKTEKELNVNIVEEYRLILQKKSKLSRANRDAVVFKFNRNFVKI